MYPIPPPPLNIIESIIDEQLVDAVVTGSMSKMRIINSGNEYVTTVVAVADSGVVDLEQHGWTSIIVVVIG
jgi:hypothetical protein